MKKNRILSLTIVLVFVLLSATVYAAHGSVTAISSGSNKVTGSASSGLYNNISHGGDAKELLADSNKVKNIYVRNVSAVGGKVYGDEQKTEHYQTHTSVNGSYSRKVDENKRATSETLARARYTDNSVSEDIEQRYISILGADIVLNKDDKLHELYDEYDKNSKDDTRQYIFNERNELKEKELEILKESNVDISQIKLFEENTENEDVFHINAAYINDYPEYRSLYIDYMNEHVGIGDYLPSGVYVDKGLNVVYFVSISDNQVYTYDL